MRSLKILGALHRPRIEAIVVRYKELSAQNKNALEGFNLKDREKYIPYLDSYFMLLNHKKRLAEMYYG